MKGWKEAALLLVLILALAGILLVRTKGLPGANLGSEAAEKEESHTDTDDGLVAIIEAKISERAEAKKARDYAKADAIRDELKAMGIQLKDSKEGTTWEKI